MKTSICIDSVYQEIPFMERFAQAARDGFDYVEFWNSEGRSPSEIGTALEENSIRLLSFNGDDKVSAIEPGGETRYLNYLEQQLTFAKAAGSQSLALHSNALAFDGKVLDDYYGVPETVKLLNLYSTMHRAAALGEKYGINLNLEPLNIYVDHIGNYLDSTEMAGEIVRKIGSPRLGVLYDAYHMHVNGEDLSILKRYIKEIGHIHIADDPGRGEPGSGQMDYNGLLQLLKEEDYQNTLGFEFFPAKDSASAVAAVRKLLKENRIIK